MFGVARSASVPAEDLAIVYVGVDWPLVLAGAVGWELMYQLAKVLCGRSPHNKIRLYGASYWTAFSNAIICSIGSVYFTSQLLGAPAQSHIASFPSDPAFPLTDGIRLVAHPFLAWLLYDVVHIILWYPELGGADQLLHHSGKLRGQ